MQADRQADTGSVNLKRQCIPFVNVLGKINSHFIHGPAFVTGRNYLLICDARAKSEKVWVLKKVFRFTYCVSICLHK